MSTSLKSLTYHVTALKLAQQGKLKEAVTFLAQCGKLADKMVEESDKLVSASKILCEKSAEAFELAIGDKTVSAQQKETIRKSMQEFQAQEASLKQKTHDLTKAVAEEQEKEQKATTQAERAQMISNVTSIISVFAGPVMAVISPLSAVATAVGTAFKKGEKSEDNDDKLKSFLDKASTAKTELAKDLEETQVQLASKEEELKQKEESKEKVDTLEINKLKIEIAELKVKISIKQESLKKHELDLQKLQSNFDKQATNAMERADKIADRRAALQKELRSASADLAASISQLQNANAKSDSLSTAITSLALSVKTLGRIQKVFENTRKFWSSVKNHCDSLTTNTELLTIIADLGEEDFVNTIKDSGLSWLALSKITKMAHVSIQGAEIKSDKLMTNLPVDPSSAQIDELSNSILVQIQTGQGNNNSK